MPRNPSELRLEDELQHWKNQLRFGAHSNKTKEFLIGQARLCCRSLGIDGPPAYNSSSFVTWLNQ